MIKISMGYRNTPISFKQANVNIMAFSDTHGDLKNTAPLFQNFQDNKDDIFEKKEEKSTLNLMTIVGDWFMNPTQKGYLSDKNKTSGDYQTIFFKSFIENTKSLIPGLKVFYTPGNHCLDAGDRVFLNHIKNLDMQTIISNADLKQAESIKNLSPKQRKKIHEYKIIEVQDDKKPELKHKVMILGITPINIDFLVKENIKGLNLLGTKDCKEAYLKAKDVDETAEIISKITKDFNGAVVLMSHAGEPVAKAIAKKVGNIDLILNAHDHLDETIPVKTQNGFVTKIVSLSENANKIESIKLHFDDDGNLSIKNNPYYTDFESNLESNPINKMYTNMLKEDITPLVKVIDPKGRQSLNIKNVRYGNNDLANFCTDAILSKIKETHPEVQAFIIPSTSFRSDLPTSITRPIINLDLIDLFKGISGDLSKVLVGDINGKILYKFILENVLDNLSNPDRNTLIQMSGIIIDKKSIKETLEWQNNKDLSSLTDFIKIKNEYGEFEPIDLEKPYSIALPKKLFVKSTIPEFKELMSTFTDQNNTVYDYFKSFVKDGPEEIKLNIDKRVLT